MVSLCVFNGSECKHFPLYLNLFIFSSHMFICPSLKVMLREENHLTDYHNLLSKLLDMIILKAYFNLLNSNFYTQDSTYIMITTKPISCYLNLD